MTTYVALLRGVNVGGRNRLAMADLRRLLAALGHGDVRTYVQSGNAVFRSDPGDAGALAAEIADRIRVEHQLEVSVVVRSAEELAAVVDGNPFGEEAAADPTRVHVAFLADEPDDPSVLAFDVERYAPDRIAAGPAVRYLHLPGGIGRSRLAADLDRRARDLAVTVRNWRTVSALQDLTR